MEQVRCRFKGLIRKEMSRSRVEEEEQGEELGGITEQKDTRRFPALHPSESLAAQMFGWR